MGTKRLISLIAGVLALAAGLGVNLSEQGLFALQPPFDSGFRVAAEPGRLGLRTDTEKIDAALELLVEAGAGAAALEASLVDGERVVGPLGVQVAREGPHHRVRVFAAGGGGVSAKFVWSPGVTVALRAPSGGPLRLRSWVLYSDQHPTDSAERVRARRHARRWLLGFLVAGFVAGAALLVSGLRRDGEELPPVDLKIQIVERILQMLELQAQPRLAALGRSILRSVLLEDMSPEDAIRRHAPTDKLGRAAFLWGRQVFLHTVTQMTTDLSAKYLARLRGDPAARRRRR